MNELEILKEKQSKYPHSLTRLEITILLASEWVTPDLALDAARELADKEKSIKLSILRSVIGALPDEFGDTASISDDLALKGGVETLKNIIADFFKEYTEKIQLLEKSLSEEEARTEVFANCLHRALKLHQQHDPDREGWPSGDVNLAWIISGFESALVVAKKASALLACHQLDEDETRWGTGLKAYVYEVPNENKRDYLVEDLNFYLQQWVKTYGEKNDEKAPTS